MWAGGLPQLTGVAKEQVGFIRRAGSAACLSVRIPPPLRRSPPSPQRDTNKNCWRPKLVRRDNLSSHNHLLAVLISGVFWVSVGSADARGNVLSVEGLDSFKSGSFWVSPSMSVSFESLLWRT